MKELKFNAVANRQAYIFTTLTEIGWQEVAGHLVQVEDITFAVNVGPLENTYIFVSDLASGGEIYNRKVNPIEMLMGDTKQAYLSWIEDVVTEAIYTKVGNDLDRIREMATALIEAQHHNFGERPELVEFDDTFGGVNNG